MAERNCIASPYRFFGVNERDVVLWEDSVGCLDDDEACAAATTRSRTGVTIEVWDVARFVGRYGVPINII